MTWTIAIILFLIIINLDSFRLIRKDKQRAIDEGFRIPDRSFIIHTLLGGGPGCLLGIRVFHHKTHRIGLILAIVFLMIAEVILLVYGFLNWGWHLPH